MLIGLVGDATTYFRGFWQPLSASFIAVILANIVVVCVCGRGFTFLRPLILKPEVRRVVSDKNYEQGYETSLGRPYFASVDVKNIKKGLRISDATVSLLFYPPNSKEPLVPRSINARWEENIDQFNQGKYQRISDLYKLPMEPNGISHRFNIAFKHEEQKDAFAFNFDSCRLPGWKNYDWAISPGEYKVRVEINASELNRPIVRFFKLYNYGTGTALKIG
ncbi:MAG: hypothetical protein AB1500_01465 [Bacillota bacterium]